MKKVYFVRHGESEGNVEGIRIDGTAPLTKRGRTQAEQVAERCARLPIEVIISSTMRRTCETTESILRRIQKPVEYSDFFIERRPPQEQVGIQRNHPRALEAQQKLQQNFGVSGFRFSDEENFEDLNARAEQALKLLADRSEQNILVVTHGAFMRMLIARAVFDDQLTPELCWRCLEKFHMENTGLTVFGFDPRKLPSPWWVWVWNDYAHLG